MGTEKIFVTPDGGMRISVAKCGHIRTNTGFIENVTNGQAVLIDAPFGAFDVSEKTLSSGTNVVAVFFTHWHWDHIGDGNIFSKLGAKTYAHALDKELIEHTELANTFSGIDEELVPCKIDATVGDGDVIDIGGWLAIKCLWVPGHSAGDLAFYIKSAGCVFAGDTLFRGGIGRSDFPGGDGKLLASAIVEKLFPLPDNTIVIPGHGNFTTIGSEKTSNEFFH
jgi:glyoxylase-like metal-dependent hydrolase (beta-lactamase superfamily II)